MRNSEKMFTLRTFYQSKDWCDFRERLINERSDKDGFVICAHCGKPVVKKYDIIGHHIRELTEDNVNDVLVALNPENVELIHFKCHNLIHQRFDGLRQYVYLVHGSPCAGKSTWVRENAYKDDLIVDLDRIWECICLSDRQNKPNRLKVNVFGLRDCLIEQIKLRHGKWRNAYVIGGYPLRSDRDRLCDILGARAIHIDTDINTCLARAVNDDWRQYIEDYWYAFTQ